MTEGRGACAQHRAGADTSVSHRLGFIGSDTAAGDVDQVMEKQERGWNDPQGQDHSWRHCCELMFSATQIKADACGSGFRCVDAWSALSSEKPQQQ